MNKHNTDILAYMTPIGWIIAFVSGKRNECKVHLNNALMIYLFELIRKLITPFFNSVNLGFIPTALEVIPLVAWVLGVLYVVRYQDRAIPLLGQIKILK